MASFSSASRSVKLYFEANTTGFDRGIARTETRLKRFERVAGKQSGVLNAGVLGGFSKGGAITAGAGLAVLGLKSVVDAASNAEVILGQTSVAVGDAGLSWEKYGDRVQATSLQIAKASGFDDEAVMQSFQVFVRGQKDVGKSLELASLAANVARGRYTDLDSATMLVNKAAMGQIGALRRAGIQIDKNATSTQALDALQRAYGGAAVRYANSAAGAQDNLRVSVENLRESLGGKLLPVLKTVVDEINAGAEAGGHLGDGLRAADKKSGGFLRDALVKTTKLSFLLNPTGQIFLGIKGINSLFGDTKSQLEDVNKLASQFAATMGGINLNPGNLPTPTSTNAGKSKKPPAFGEPGFKTVKPEDVPHGPSASQRNRMFDEAIGRREDRVQDIATPQGRLKALQGIRATIQAEIARVKDPTRKLNLGDEVAQVDREIKGLNDEIAQGIKDKATSIKEAARNAAQAFKDQANDIKNAALSIIDSKEQKFKNANDLADAQAALKVARQIGGKEGIKLAQRDVQTARFAQQRQRIEDTPFSVREGPKGPVDTVQVGSITFNINGNQSPEAIANAVLARLQKKGKKNAPQSRGRTPGHHLGVT